ncbi:MAG TPA: trypsin-like peptidase domain-containing protein [Candidatus Solibacter sp.]|nr:trypsin-like peptidase domain-containing protein [Candidatus Solibacter sp.]
MRHLTFPVLLAVGLSAFAQQPQRKEPLQYAGPERASRVEARPPGLRLGLRRPRQFVLAPLSESESARLIGPASRLKRIGVQRQVAAHALAAGAWETTAEGTRVWRIAIHSPGARGMRVEFSDFNVGAGKVWVHDGANTAGPYTGRGLFDDGTFVSAAVYSDSATIEYEPAADADAELEPPFQIKSIVHQAMTALDAAAGKKDPAEYCELDVNCYSEWKSSLTSVAQISFLVDGDEGLCSGSLLATRDNSLKPYFLTAGHCVPTEAVARTVQAYWTYQTSACGGAPPTTRDASTKSTLGAHLISAAGQESGDFSLILLPDVPSGVTFAGWDPGGPAVGGDVTGIHHPSGSWKRISFGERTGDATQVVQGSVAPGDKYYEILMSGGRVEHGSSGSPLFSSPGVIVASLSYGAFRDDGTVCPLNPQLAGYSRFSVAYAAAHDFLENIPADLVTPAPAALTFTVRNGAAPAGQAVQLTTQTTGQIGYKLRADASWIQVSALTGTVSAKTPVPVTISVDPAQLKQAGTYTSTVTVFSGAAPLQYITVNAIVVKDQSNVVATVSPNPVEQSTGQWSFQIKLAETAGAATHITAAKFNGTDYTSSVANWFGTMNIPAGGTIIAPLTGAGRFPAGDQYFEFWGVDDASGQPWYRTAVVTFR